MESKVAHHLERFDPPRGTSKTTPDRGRGRGLLEGTRVGTSVSELFESER